MPADDFLWTPSNQSGLNRNPKVAEIVYDDGYVLSVKAGINNNPFDGEFQFTNIDTTTAKAIDDFLSARGGYTSFLWTPPAPWDVQKRWRCKSWGWVYQGGVIVGVRAKFDEWFQ
jgi:phage-related protein